jgi:hypothetical protein
MAGDFDGDYSALPLPASDIPVHGGQAERRRDRLAPVPDLINRQRCVAVAQNAM